MSDDNRALQAQRLLRTRRITEDDVLLMVELGKLTQAEADAVLMPTTDAQRQLAIIRQRDAAVAAVVRFAEAGKLADSDLLDVPDAFAQWQPGDTVWLAIYGGMAHNYTDAYRGTPRKRNGRQPPHRRYGHRLCPQATCGPRGCSQRALTMLTPRARR